MLIQSFSWDLNEVRQASSDADQDIDNYVEVVALQSHEFSTSTHIGGGLTLLLAFRLERILSCRLLQR